MQAVERAVGAEPSQLAIDGYDIDPEASRDRDDEALSVLDPPRDRAEEARLARHEASCLDGRQDGGVAGAGADGDRSRSVLIATGWRPRRPDRTEDDRRRARPACLSEAAGAGRPTGEGARDPRRRTTARSVVRYGPL